jgi:negative regulator of flagellin synthesis FlgM
MRIDGNVQPVSGIYTKDKKVSHVENINKSAEVKDNVKISTKGKDFAVAQKALKEIPDVRKEKVRNI